MLQPSGDGYLLPAWYGGIATEITGQRISQNLNAAYAGSFSEFLRLTFLAMSTAWYLYGLALYFLCAKWFQHYKIPLLIVAAVLNYLAVERVSRSGDRKVWRSILSFLYWAHFGGHPCYD